jgi:hypothetical protein
MPSRIILRPNLVGFESCPQLIAVCLYHIVMAVCRFFNCLIVPFFRWIVRPNDSIRMNVFFRNYPFITTSVSTSAGHPIWAPASNPAPRQVIAVPGGPEVGEIEFKTGAAIEIPYDVGAATSMYVTVTRTRPVASAG